MENEELICDCMHTIGLLCRDSIHDQTVFLQVNNELLFFCFF